MDKQLACATFATLIPVLLIAGLFADVWDLVGSGRPFRIVAGLVTTACLAAEMIAISGTAATHPTHDQVLAAMTGAYVALAAPFAAFYRKLIDSPGDQVGDDERHGDQRTGDV